MDPILAGVMTGGMSLIGDLIEREDKRKAASKEREFQERMSNSAYQRARADMEAAGFNPILAAGNPASTPGGSLGQTTDLGSGVEGAVSSALDYKRLKQDLNESRSRTRLNEENINTQKTVQELNKAQAASAYQTGTSTQFRNIDTERQREFEKSHPKFWGATDAILRRVLPWTR